MTHTPFCQIDSIIRGRLLKNSASIKSSICCLFFRTKTDLWLLTHGQLVALCDSWATPSAKAMWCGWQLQQSRVNDLVLTIIEQTAFSKVQKDCSSDSLPQVHACTHAGIIHRNIHGVKIWITLLLPICDVITHYFNNEPAKNFWLPRGGPSTSFDILTIRSPNRCLTELQRD